VPAGSASAAAAPAARLAPGVGLGDIGFLPIFSSSWFSCTSRLDKSSYIAWMSKPCRCRQQQQQQQILSFTCEVKRSSYSARMSKLCTCQSSSRRPQHNTGTRNVAAQWWQQLP
jgi:hypothetical protein